MHSGREPTPMRRGKTLPPQRGVVPVLARESRSLLSFFVQPPSPTSPKTHPYFRRHVYTREVCGPCWYQYYYSAKCYYSLVGMFCCASFFFPTPYTNEPQRPHSTKGWWWLAGRNYKVYQCVNNSSVRVVHQHGENTRRKFGSIPTSK